MYIQLLYVFYNTKCIRYSFKRVVRCATLFPLPMKLSSTGKNIRPCAAPKITILKYIRKKNIWKI